MKFSIAAVASLISAVTAATLPSAFTLVADGGKTVLTDGESLFIGGNASEYEIAILQSGANGAVTFTSTNETPTGWQNLYIVENEVEPVGMTRPHSAALPEGATANGFGVNDDGYFTNGDKAWFAVAAGNDPAKRVYWYGSHNGAFGSANLWVKEFKQ
ncbi:hypothetical protein AOR_1_66064 [Paecilomyces variotii No. 5]|uniref:Uncharacterized protein n=1 Tax=Byssochlamys spectabilis (strain No. 5 / NBRC 109023) TaxID=1356009 RepID=V5I4B7_BYSSN|nr:hypothetical protein AOR_1_66064 [Paecilomyces variotii No. 5]